MNLARVGALELSEHGLRFNFVARGWSGVGEEAAFVEQLRAVHRADNIPLLPYVSDEEYYADHSKHG